MAATAQPTRDAAFITRAKCTLTTALGKGQLSEKTKAKMWLAAQKRPDVFGKWADIFGKAGEA